MATPPSLLFPIGSVVLEELDPGVPGSSVPGWLELPEESPPESPVPGSSPEPPGSPLGSSTPLGSSGSMIWPPSPWTVHCSVPAAAT